MDDLDNDKMIEIDNFLDSWGDFSNKVFVWKRDFLPNEYILVRKVDGDMVLDARESTRIIKPFNKWELRHMMFIGELFYRSEYHFSMRLIDLKTDGCTCGLWALKEDAGLHDVGCPKRKLW